MFQKKSDPKTNIAGIQQRINEITAKLADIEKEIASETARITAASNSRNDADLANIAIASIYEKLGKASPVAARGMGRLDDLKAEKEMLTAELTQLTANLKK